MHTGLLQAVIFQDFGEWICRYPVPGILRLPRKWPILGSSLVRFPSGDIYMIRLSYGLPSNE